MATPLTPDQITDKLMEVYETFELADGCLLQDHINDYLHGHSPNTVKDRFRPEVSKMVRATFPDLNVAALSAATRSFLEEAIY